MRVAVLGDSYISGEGAADGIGSDLEAPSEVAPTVRFMHRYAIFLLPRLRAERGNAAWWWRL